MPRKRKETSYKESDGSDYQTESDATADDDKDDEDDLTVESDQKAPARKKSKSSSPKKTPSAKKPSSVKSNTPIYDIDDDDEDLLPTEFRKTVAGGYAHTNKSKLKISQANKGNVPWNKGKERSALQRAKIAAGVRARNREALLKKLAILGLTEEEYEAKQKKVSNLRDRLWKLKKQNKEKAERFTEHLRKLENGEAAQKEEDQLEQELQQQATLQEKQHQKQQQEVEVEEEEVEESSDDENADDEDSVNEEEDRDNRLHPVLAVFTPDIQWTPHTFDPPPKHLKQRLVRYNEICPNNGPGGLICCSVCAATYSGYLSSTLKSMTVQRTSKLAAETEELLDMLTAAKSRLVESVKVARKKPPPVPSVTI
ncbi:hypothetical protein FisN_16Lh083 [Fistulifera solaris]|uniref:Nuclease associated modular domain-containing protein n=1 Tax=Fistulifera solaris TaxID=1519565 RepID=A0A1Z5KIY8_FISSO|nr:hypothetical protein FisN_16Lh083 [Fistulifera solaris]|eukprot:GAX26253.1 hypothetical protein FisN_16Lh083 [Fistulifera solaris]